MAENSLRRLRRAAGFSSAKALAESVGIPPATYAKYEQIDDGPDTSMPIKNAWLIADALGCSIDELVGRSSVPEDAADFGIQRRFDALSEDGKRIVADFIGLAEEQDARFESRRRAELSARYAAQMEDYYRTFTEGFDFDAIDDESGWGPLGRDTVMREMFKGFVEGRVAESLQRRADEQLAEAKKLYESQGFAVLETFEPKYSAARVLKGEAGYAEALEQNLAGTKEAFDRHAAALEKEVVEGIMAAYDAAHPRKSAHGGSSVEYTFIRMP